MDVALLNLLEDRSPTPSPPAARAARRLRDLWLAGVPLERAAAAAGLTVTEAEDRLSRLGYELTPEATTFEVEPLGRLYVDDWLPAAEVVALLGGGVPKHELLTRRLLEGLSNLEVEEEPKVSP